MFETRYVAVGFRLQWSFLIPALANLQIVQKVDLFCVCILIIDRQPQMFVVLWILVLHPTDSLYFVSSHSSLYIGTRVFGCLPEGISDSVHEMPQTLGVLSQAVTFEKPIIWDQFQKPAKQRVLEVVVTCNYLALLATVVRPCKEGPLTWTRNHLSWRRLARPVAQFWDDLHNEVLGKYDFGLFKCFWLFEEHFWW